MESRARKSPEKEVSSLVLGLLRQAGPLLQDGLRPLIEAAFNAGREYQRKKMNKAIHDVLESNIRLAEIENKLEEAKEEAHANGVLLPGEYGATAQAVRIALDHFRTEEESGASVEEIVRFLHKKIGFREVTPAQVRNTLKGLIKSREVIRPQRGVYAPGPRFPGNREAA